MDVAKLRRDTPACENVLHLDHAGSSLPPNIVVETVKAHLDREAAVGGYRAAQEAAAEVERVYADIAEFIGAKSDEVALVDSATRAWQLAFAAVPFEDGDRILCSRVEYASNHLAFLQLRQHFDVEIVPVPSTEGGTIDLKILERELGDGAALVALTHVPTNGGLVQPAGDVGRLAREHDVPFLLDACQSAGQVDLREVPWDMISVTGRKYLRGPRGTGFLGVRRAWLERLNHPLLDLHGAKWTAVGEYEVRDDARRFELWEKNYADVLGLGAAVRYALDCGPAALQTRIAQVAEALRNRLVEVPGVQVHDQGHRRCGIVTVTIDGCDPSDLKAALRARDVHVSVSSRTSTLLDMDDRGLTKLLRASVHALTNEAELDAFVRHLHSVRKTS